ncbi:MAG: hypothetical protein ACI82G_001124, partial [Bradymonadia bacterium]
PAATPAPAAAPASGSGAAGVAPVDEHAEAGAEPTHPSVADDPPEAVTTDDAPTCALGELRDHLTEVGEHHVRLNLDVSTLFGPNCPADPGTPRIVPQREDGETLGYRWFAVRAGNVWWALGLRSGDVFVALDGSVVPPLPPRALFDRITQQGGAVLTVLRDGERLDLRVETEVSSP